jgi:hypothetical protein
VQHTTKRSPPLNDKKSSGVRLRLEQCIASIMHIMLQFSNIILTGWWLLFQNWGFFCIEDLDLHNLVVKKASSLLLMPLKYFIKLLAKLYMSYHYCIKSKRFFFHNEYEVVFSIKMVVTLGWWVVGPGYDICGWWRSHCNLKVHLGLISNVASDSSAINNGQPWDMLWDGEVSCIFSLSHING